MKAVIMAGGEGTRLRPLSLGGPKPMVPLLGRPVMEHILNLLKSHGVTDICVTLCYRPEKITEYFGDGSSFGVRLTYFVEETPLGTAGSVKACMDYLGDEDFLVISGDGVCDLDLSAAIEAHREQGACATLLLYPHPTPLEYGLVLTDETGRIQQFVEKPAWGQVVTNQVNTGIYLLGKKAMEYVPQGEAYDFGGQLFPALLAAKEPLFGCVGGGYWCDMGDCEAYLQCVEDALSGKVRLNLGLTRHSPGVWAAQPPPEDVKVVPPCWIGPGVRVEAGSLIGPHVVLEENSRVGPRSLVQRSVLLPGAEVEARATLYGAILCPGAVAGRETVLNEGAVLGERALAEPGAVLLERVKLWPARVAPAGGRLSRSLTGQAGQPPLRFGNGGSLRGRLGEELGPEVLMTLGALLGRGGSVGLGGHGGAGADMLLQAAASGIAAAGGTALLHDLECPAQAAWLAEKEKLPVSLFLQQEGEEVFLHFFGPDGLPLGRARQRKLEQGLLQGESPRAPGSNIGGIRRLSAGMGNYAADGARRALLYRMPLRPLTVAVAGQNPADRAVAKMLGCMGCTVVPRWEKGIAAFSAGRGGFRLTAQDETGAHLDGGQLLTLLCLIEMENGGGRVAVPAEATAAAELVAAGFGGTVLRLGRDGQEAEELYRALPWMRDAAFAAARLCARMASAGERLSELMTKTPRFSTWRQEVPLRCDRGRVMRALTQEYGTPAPGGAGLRFRTGRGWVHLTPVARRAALRVVAEGPDLELAAELCDLYARRVRDLDEAAGGERQAEGPAENG